MRARTVSDLTRSLQRIGAHNETTLQARAITIVFVHVLTGSASEARNGFSTCLQEISKNRNLQDNECKQTFSDYKQAFFQLKFILSFITTHLTYN